MFTRHLFRSAWALGLLLAACYPQVVEVPVTVVVKETQIQTVVETAGVPQPTLTPRPEFVTPHLILGDVRVRQGIAYCTNRAQLIAAVYPWLEDTTAFEMASFIPRGHWAYPPDDAEFARYSFDPQAGKALFEAAGWTLAAGATYRTNAVGEEMALKLTTTTAEFRQKWAAAFEEQMKACGLRILRFHVPATWLFGDTTGLVRRDFELVAYAWAYVNDPGGRQQYACDQIPSPENEWKGQNYMGWCNPKADEAIRAATTALSQAERREAYRVVQAEFTKDLPSLPLFTRADVNATNPALENFVLPGSSGYYTWNAAEWKIPGKDTLVIGEASEPASLFALVEDAYTARLLQALVFGLNDTPLDSDYTPLMLKEFPTVENGGAMNNAVAVKEGESVVDTEGNVVTLAPGTRIRTASGEEVEFTGGTVEMNQLTVKYEFVEGLTWSDGVPVTKADYELAYKIGCDPATGATQFAEAPYHCEKMARVEFLSDTAYVATWKPGFQDPRYFLPPLGRQPAHLVLSDGRKLADVPAYQWAELDEVKRHPLGVGPYVMNKWEYGREMVFTANPHYYLGPPATPIIIVRFLEREQALGAMARGEIDVLGWDSVSPEDVETLLPAQAEGKVRLYFTPSATYEHIDFALFVK